MVAKVVKSCTSPFSVGTEFEVSTITACDVECPEFVPGEYAYITINEKVEDEIPKRMVAFSIYKADEDGTIIEER